MKKYIIMFFIVIICVGLSWGNSHPRGEAKAETLLPSADDKQDRSVIDSVAFILCNRWAGTVFCLDHGSWGTDTLSLVEFRRDGSWFLEFGKYTASGKWSLVGPTELVLSRLEGQNDFLKWYGPCSLKFLGDLLEITFERPYQVDCTLKLSRGG